MTAYRSRSYPAGPNRLRARRKCLLVGGALGAFVALAGHAEPAHAQAINATPATTAGNVTYSRFGSPTPGSETITVETPSAIINWTPPAGPLPNPYVFLPAGNTVTYQNGANNPDFAVLNRILTTTPSRFDGTVISRLQPAGSGAPVPGGTVLFSSPGGIIVGPTAVFDVGNLVLTSLNVVDDGAGDFGGTTNSFVFDGGDANPNAAVVTLPGSQITANSTNSYVALVAPVLNIGGSARVNGSVGYIAGEALSFTVNAGLFDINVTTGSDNPTPITHSGSTGGPASTGSGDNQVIYMVAVPKNQAITMLLTGNVGYDAATDVSIENGQIVLSAGYNVIGGFRDEVNAAQDANISIQGGTYTSDVVGQASGNATATATAGNPLDFDESLSLQAAGRAELIAGTGATATIGENLALLGIDPITRNAGEAHLIARSGATVTVTGNAVVSADNIPAPGPRDVADGEDRQAGTASAETQGGSIQVGGNLNVTADAVGGSGTFSGGDGLGGTAFVEAQGGTIAATGDINVFAVGLGAPSPGLAGNGEGGDARVSALGGSISSGGNLYINAGAIGGPSLGFGTADGLATGGGATLEINGGGSVNAAETLVVADAGQLVFPVGFFSPLSPPSVIGPFGAAQGGTANVTVTGGNLTTNIMFVSANALGGPGNVPPSIAPGGDGFDATGGTALVQIDGGSIDIGSLLVVAAAQGGAGANGQGGGTGGIGTGGRASLTITNVTPLLDDVVVAAGGFGGNGGSGLQDDSFNGTPGGNGGQGFGGDAEMTIGAGASLTLATLELDANAAGGGGGPGADASKFGGDGGLGASGSAGNATLRVTGGDLTVTSTDGFAVLARGIGGTGGTGGDSPSGPGGVGGDAGNASGGTALVDLTGGSITSFGSFVISSGIGGPGGLGGFGSSFGNANSGLAGTGVGGLSRISLADSDSETGSASLGATSLLSDGISGSGASTPADTAGVTIFDELAGGLVQLDSLDVSALGGPSADGRGFAFTSNDGAVNVAGDVTIDVTGGITFTVTGSGGLLAGGLVDVDTAGSILIDHQSRAAGAATLSGASVELDALGNVTANSDSLIAATIGDVVVDALGAVDLGIVTAAGNVFVDPTSIDIDSVTAGGDINLDASGDINVGFAQAGDDFTATAGGTFTGGTVIATGLGRDSEVDTASPLAGYNIFIDANGDLTLDNGTAPDTINLISRTGSIFSGGALTADTLLATTAGDLALNDVFVVSALNLTANSGAISGNSFNSDGDVTLRASNGIDVNAIDTGGSFLVKTAGAVVLGTIVAVGDIIIDPTDIIIDSAIAGGDISLTASNDITIGFAQAGDDFTASAGNAFTGGTVIATGLGTDSEKGIGALAGGNIQVTASADLRLDNGDAARDIRLSTRAGSIFSDGLLTAGNDIFGTAPQDIDINDADAGASIFLNAGGFIDTGNAVAGTDVALTAGGDISVASAQAGDDFTASAGGAFNGGSVTVTGLAPTDEASGTLVGNNIVVTADNGDLRLDNGTAPDRIDLTASTGSILGNGTLTADTLLANAALDILINDVFVVTSLNLSTPGGSIGGNSFNSDGNINLDAAGTVTVAAATSGGSTVVTAVGDATLGTFVAAGSINVNAAALSFTSATAGSDIILTTSGNMSVGTARAGDDFIAISNNGTFTGGSVTTTGAGADTEGGVGAFAGSNIFITANGDLRLDNSSSPGRVGLGSSTGSILSSGTLNANRLTAFAALNLALTNVTTVADLVLTTTNGNISGNVFTSNGNITLTSSGTIGLNRANSGGNVVLRSVGNLRLDAGTATGRIDLASSTADVLSGGGGSDSIGTLSAGGDILANAARDVLLLSNAQAGGNIDVDAGRNATLGNLTAGGSVLVDAVGTARFTGSVGAPTINVTSSDIDIAAAGFGNSGTQLVSLTVRPTTNQTVLGGTTQGPGYTLTDAEADRISAVTLRIQAPVTGSAASRPADLLVRDLSLSGQQVRTLQLVTSGIAEVNGGLILSGVQANGGINIQATERLQIVNPTGSIRVRDGAGLTAGTLNLTSNNIWSATQAILTQLLADSNFAGRDTALLQPSGSDAERGSIEGGTTTLTARDTLFVQNSGSLALFSGITVRQNTLNIVPTGSSPLRVFAFGRRINPDGSFVTNSAFFREVVFQTRLGTPGYTNESEFNRCFINSGACGGDTIPGGKDLVEEPVESTLNIGLPGEGEDLVDTSFAQEALIEEPVTSGADSIQWDCDTDDDGDCDEDDVNG